MRCGLADNFIGNRACALYNRRMQTALDIRQKDLAIEMLYGHFFWSKRSGKSPIRLWLQTSSKKLTLNRDNLFSGHIFICRDLINTDYNISTDDGKF